MSVEGVDKAGGQAEGWLVWIIPAGSGAQGPSLVVWYLPWVMREGGRGPRGGEPHGGGGGGGLWAGWFALEGVPEGEWLTLCRTWPSWEGQSLQGQQGPQM